MYRWLIISMIFVMLLQPGEAQNQQWMQIYLNGKLTGNWEMTADAGMRRKDNFSQWSQGLIRGGIKRQWDSGISITTGLGYFWYYSDGTVTKREIRPYQELNFKAGGKWKTSHRFRAEMRNFIVDENSDFRCYRFRYRLMVEKEIWKEEQGGRKLTAGLGDEVFSNAGAPSGRWLDQNRILLSASYALNSNWSVSLTWNQQLSPDGEGEIHSTKVLWVGLKHQLRFHSE